MKTVTTYVTEDGRDFTDINLAKNHEEYLNITEWLKEQEPKLGPITAGALASVLMEYPTLVSRGLAKVSLV